MTTPAPRPPAPASWHTLPWEEAAHRLGTDPIAGLAGREAAHRLAAGGPNELAERPRPGFLILLLGQFKNFLVLILIAAAVVSIILGEWVDAAAILLIVVLNAVLGVAQESRAENALAALKRLAAPEARVLRDGLTLTVPARELVKGDIVLLEAGNFVPADVRLAESVNLRVEEASLTGESVPVEKDAAAAVPGDAPLGDRATMAYMSTMVSFGRGRGMVVRTGMETEIGLIASLLQEKDREDTPLQKRLSQMGRWLAIAALAICAVVFAVGVLGGRNILMMFMTSVSLAIAAVPEGLPAIVTICLALGMQEMIKRHALVRKLPAVETLGSATAICTDKTGTLTQNEMTARCLYADGEMLEITGEGYQPVGGLARDGAAAELEPRSAARLCLQAAMLASDARLEPSALEPGKWRMVGDPTEGALVVAAAKASLHRDAVEKGWPRTAELPFDSARKLMSTIHRVPAGGLGETAPLVAFVKGAPDLLLGRCTAVLTGGAVLSLTEEARRVIHDVNAGMASRALRVLGVAYRPLDEAAAGGPADEVERDLVFLGLIGMMDPARPEAAGAVERARRAGLRVIMVTGDYRETAAAVGRQIGLIREAEPALSGAEIDTLSEQSLADALGKVSVFARVSPQHKVRIVEALRGRGEVVGMTGDGVNDAPALKRADIGIAMGISGTDVTKETADMVLTDDNFASIISAVEQGRVIFSNIRKFVYYLLSCNLGEIGTVFVGTLLGWPVPLTAIQLLWTNLVTDGAPALALGLERAEPGIMDRPPRPPGEPIIGRAMIASLALQMLSITGCTLLAFWLGMTRFGGEQAARTMAFLCLSVCQLVRAYTSRSERASVFSIRVFSNRWMQYAVLSSLALLAAVLFIPFLRPVFALTLLPGPAWAVLVPLVLFPAVVDEITKKAASGRRRGGDGAPEANA